MKLHEREALLARVAAGDVPLTTAFDVGADDIQALTRVGAAALAAGRNELAERVFAGLCALAPDEPVHQLHLAAALSARNAVAGAVAALDKALADQRLAREDEVEALLLRAELVGKSDPKRALVDLTRARSLEARAAPSSSGGAR